MRILGSCAVVLAVLAAGVALAQHGASRDAKGIPGARGQIEFKPGDWQGKGITSYWKDTDGVNPGVAGCHIGVSKDGTPNGRFFGEACVGGLLVESNPGTDEIHPHTDDTGHPDTFDCNAWCVGTKQGTGGMCKVVAGPAPCNKPNGSARCECTR